MKYFKTFLFIVAFSLFSLIGTSQPPPPQGGHGESNNQPPGGGAPIGSGMLILIGLGAVYGGKKLYKIKEENIDKQ